MNNTLIFEQTRYLKDEFIVKDGETTVARFYRPKKSIDEQNKWYLLLEYKNNRWAFVGKNNKLSNLLLGNLKFQLLDFNTKEELATFNSSGNNGVFEITSGSKYLWKKPTWWSNEEVITTVNGNEVIRFVGKTKGWLLRRAKGQVIINSKYLTDENRELVQILFFGIFLKILKTITSFAANFD